MTAITRRTAVYGLTIASGAALSEAFDFSRVAMGVVQLPADWTAADIGFQVSTAEAGTYVPLYDEDGALVEISSPAASQAHVLPVKTAGCLWVKLWSQSGGVSVNQGADRALTVAGKG